MRILRRVMITRSVAAAGSVAARVVAPWCPARRCQHHAAPARHVAGCPLQQLWQLIVARVPFGFPRPLTAPLRQLLWAALRAPSSGLSFSTRERLEQAQARCARSPSTEWLRDGSSQSTTLPDFHASAPLACMYACIYLCVFAYMILCTCAYIHITWIHTYKRICMHEC